MALENISTSVPTVSSSPSEKINTPPLSQDSPWSKEDGLLHPNAPAKTFEQKNAIIEALAKLLEKLAKFWT